MIGPPHPPSPTPACGGEDGGLGQSVPATLSPLLQTGESGGTDLPEPHPLSPRSKRRKAKVISERLHRQMECTPDKCQVGPAPAYTDFFMS